MTGAFSSWLFQECKCFIACCLLLFIFIELKSIHDTLTRMLTLTYLIKPQLFWEGAHEPHYPNCHNETNCVGRFRGLVWSLLAAAAGGTKSSDTTVKQFVVEYAFSSGPPQSVFKESMSSRVGFCLFFFPPHNYLMIRKIIISLLQDNSKSHHINRVSLYIVTG